MDLQRTNGMKTIGVINIIVGAMFCLIGLLRVASWGRTLSLAHAALGVLVYAAWLIGGGFDAFFLAALVYALALIWLFYNTRWNRSAA